MLKFPGLIYGLINLISFSAVITFGGIFLAVFWLLPLYFAEKCGIFTTKKAPSNDS